ncbi:MAG: tRNA dihydrouridine synthase DusB, partial [Gammaproteobacteria bacterium]|nr:tRNA dihydrouridine synthase DusB [Gammaproteobacteria bacterium]
MTTRDLQAADGAGFRIGRWQITAPAVLAPMAGVTDRPFRILARQQGAALAAS